MAIKNVFFDLDGTIIDSSIGIFRGLKAAMVANGYPEPDDATLKSTIGPPLIYTIGHILNVKEEDKPNIIKHFRGHYEELVLTGYEIYPGVEEALKRLSDHGYSISLASSKPYDYCIKILNDLGIEKYFTDIEGARIDKQRNTKEEVIEELFRKSPWQKRTETVLIGDTKYDMMGARTAHIFGLGITYGFGTRDELVENGATEVFDTLEEVCNYIEER